MWPKDGFGPAGALHRVRTMRAVDLLGSSSCKRSSRELKIERGDALPWLITSSPCRHWQLTQEKLSMHVLRSSHTCTYSYIHIHLTLSVCFILNFFIPASLSHSHGLITLHLCLPPSLFPLPSSLVASRKAKGLSFFLTPLSFSLLIGDRAPVGC